MTIAIQFFGLGSHSGSFEVLQSRSLSLSEGEGGVRELQKSPRVRYERSEKLSAREKWMPTRLLVLSTLALAFVGSLHASVKDDINHQYKRWGNAALVNDVETILSILAPDYTLHTYTGTVIKRSDYETSLRKRKASNKPATVYHTSMYSIAVQGVIAKVISDETSENPSVDPITNKKLRLVHIHRYLDTWIKTGGIWRLQTTITQVESTKVVPAQP